MDLFLPDTLPDVRELLVEMKRDLHNIVEHLLEEPVTWSVAVSSAHPLMIDKRERWHLYIASAVSMELFFPDLAGQTGQPVMLPFPIAAGRFTELPFRTGDKLLAPGIANTAENVVLLLAQNWVLQA